MYVYLTSHSCMLLIFFFHDSPTTEFYTLSLHDALPISRPADAAALSGPRALLGLDQRVSQAPRARQRHDGRPAPGGARSHGGEPRLVLGRVDVSGGPPAVRRHRGVRHGGPQTDPHGQADAVR